MPDITLTCEGCGVSFSWTEKEQKERENTAEDAIGDLMEPEPFCKICRPKQDGQRG